MLTVYEIKEVLEAHSGMCLDNERERATVAAALYQAMEKAAKPKKTKAKAKR